MGIKIDWEIETEILK